SNPWGSKLLRTELSEVSISTNMSLTPTTTKFKGTTMAEPWRMKVTMTAAFIFAASAANGLADDANAAKPAKKAAPVGPAQAVLLSLETRAYEAWKSKDSKFWESFLADKFVGWGSSGRLDKASATKEYTGADCEIESYAISDVQMTPLGRDAALITHK